MTFTRISLMEEEVRMEEIRTSTTWNGLPTYHTGYPLDVNGRALPMTSALPLNAPDTFEGRYVTTAKEDRRERISDFPCEVFATSDGLAFACFASIHITAHKNTMGHGAKYQVYDNWKRVIGVYSGTEASQGLLGLMTTKISSDEADLINTQGALLTVHPCNYNKPLGVAKADRYHLIEDGLKAVKEMDAAMDAALKQRRKEKLDKIGRPVKRQRQEKPILKAKP